MAANSKMRLKLLSESGAPLPYSTNPSVSNGKIATDEDRENGLEALMRLSNESNEYFKKKYEDPEIDRMGKTYAAMGMSPDDARNHFDLATGGASMIGSIEDVAGKIGKLAKAGKAVKELPMDQASRMARAEELGFDTGKTYYHGSKADIPAFSKDNLGNSTGAGSAKEGFFFASDPSTASDYASLSKSRDTLKNKGVLADSDLDKHINEMALKKEQIGLSYDLQDAKKRLEAAEASAHSWSDEYIANKIKEYPEDAEMFKIRQLNGKAGLEGARKRVKFLEDQLENFNGRATNHNDALKTGENVLPVHLKTKNPYVHDFEGADYRDTSYAELMKKAKELGHDSVIFKNTYDPGDPNNRVLQDIISVFEPNQIRSKNAKFDPKQKKSANILAGLAGATTLGAAMDGEEEESPKLRALKQMMGNR